MCYERWEREGRVDIQGAADMTRQQHHVHEAAGVVGLHGAAAAAASVNITL